MKLRKNIFLIVFFLFLSSFIFEYKDKKENQIKILNYFLEENKNNIESQQSYSKYIGILEIPALKLKQGFYAFSSPLNTVEKGIMLISGSQMPNLENSALILAAHSGNSHISYFKNLSSIKKGEQVFIYYKEKKYTYFYERKYKEKKDGTIEIRKNKNKNELFLITCDKKNDDLQEIYVFFLLNEEDYIG